ncbi:FG-GAP-like repeat-containing protein [Dyadobacter bucti]|uniref:FG-GAP-like repeat-containing protein n=1 Tax=Dyadobacter bucti TaxID=2572203 RepID=UPI001108B0E4|nr:FG-GAP-like repeat-containing protein [Dyadobacter bucti]
MKPHYKVVFVALLVLAISAIGFWPIVNVHVPSKSAGQGPVGTKPEGRKNDVIPEKTVSSIQQNLAKREYNMSFDEQARSFQSPNRKHNLRAYYKPGSFKVRNRIDSTGHNFQLELVNKGIFANGKQLYAPQPNAAIENLDNKLLIKHRGFTEEFVNSEDGVRQNFIIGTAPADTKQLQVRLAANGLKVNDLQTNELHFYTQNKTGAPEKQLVYKDLKCWDADGKILAASLHYQNGLVVLSVNVENAAYPVTIDPLVIHGNPDNAKAKLESNQAGAQAGYSVSSAGDVNGDGYSDVIAGAPFYDKGQTNEGAVFIYHGSATGLGGNPALVLESNQPEAQFGTSVSTAGDVNKDGYSDIIAGAPMYDKGEANEGAAFVYHGSAAGINANNPVILESNQADAKFGRAVDGVGDVNGDGYSDVAVGAPLYDKGQSNEGAVFVYQGSALGINVNTALTLESNQAEASFGQSVAGAGDVNGDGFSDLVTGAILFDKGQNNEGAAFVFHGSAAGVNTNAAVVLENNQASAAHGWSVASAGDVNGDGYGDLVVGSYLYDNGQVNEGAAFVYHGSQAGANPVAAVTLESNQAEARGGISVACAGDVNGDGYSDILVGVWQFDQGEANEGAVMVHQGSATGIIKTPVSTMEGNQAHAAMGWSVKSAGDVNGDGYSDIIAGANMFDNGQVDEGAAFVWCGGAEGVNIAPVFSHKGNQNEAQFGWSVKGAGDVNGDGFGDIIVGAPAYDNGQSDEGTAFIYHGSANGISNVNAYVESNQINAAMGKSVSGAGDVNGDGYDDVIVGVAYYTNQQQYEGAAFVYYGSVNGIITNAPSILESNQQNAWMGKSVSTAGDVNGDGFSDVIVGIDMYDNGELDEGAAFIYYGSQIGVSPISVTKIESNKAAAHLGYSVSHAGDVNGDGYGDVIVGAPFYTNVQNTEGVAIVFTGSASGINSSIGIRLAINQLEAHFGYAVSSAGDVNGDGFGDVIAGANDYGFLYNGSPNGIANQAPVKIDNNQSNTNFGESVASAGDVNGDGYGDVIIGAMGHYNSANWDGAAFLYYGSKVGILPGAVADDTLNSTSGQENSFFGHSVAGAGDINGDGFSDVIVGAHQYDKGQNNEGAAFVFYGNQASLKNNLRLYNTNLTTPINQTQLAKNDFGAGLYAKSFLGKNKGKLVWETKAKGQGFSKGADNSITNSTQSSGSQNIYTSLGLTGLELKNVIAKQGPSTKVRVRVKYDPALAITGQVYGPWRYLPSYLVGNAIAPAPEEVINDMSQTVKTKAQSLEPTAEKVSVYPNPVSEKLFVEAKNTDQICHLQLFTVNGKSVGKTTRNDIDVRNLESGIYILVITHKDGSQSSQKVVVKR